MVSLNINYMQAKEQEWVTAETNINFEVRSPKGSLKIFLGNSLGLYYFVSFIAFYHCAHYSTFIFILAKSCAIFGSLFAENKEQNQ